MDKTLNRRRDSDITCA